MKKQRKKFKDLDLTQCERKAKLKAVKQREKLIIYRMIRIKKLPVETEFAAGNFLIQLYIIL